MAFSVSFSAAEFNYNLFLVEQSKIGGQVCETVDTPDF